MLKTRIILCFLIFIGLTFSFCRKDDKDNLHANFSSDFNWVNEGEIVTFTDISEYKYEVDTWNWVFNGGVPSYSEEPSPEVIYNEAGVYAVSLTVGSGEKTHTIVKSQYITVKTFECGNRIVDIRDKNSYETVLIDNMCWLKSNLNVGEKIAISTQPSHNGIIEKYCFIDDASYCHKFGGLYTWGEMMKYTINPSMRGICPIGFRPPAKEEFEALINYAGGSSIAGGRLKSQNSDFWQAPNSGATDSYGFSALGSGTLDNHVYGGLRQKTYFWTNTLHNPDSVYVVMPAYDTAAIAVVVKDLSVAASVRCIKE